MFGSQAIKFPGIPAVMDGGRAVLHCEREASGAAPVLLTLPAAELDGLWSREVAAGHCNISGRPLLQVEVESEAALVAAAAGLALTGLRTAGFVPESALRASLPELTAMADQHLTVMFSVAGQAGCLAAAGSGWFQLIARDAQAAADLCLIAHRLAEQALLPGMVVREGSSGSRSMESILLPERELIAEYLGLAEEEIAAPTPAQRLLFGPRRRRIPEQWNVDEPAAAGLPLLEEARLQALAAQGPYFAAHLPALADEAMERFHQLTGRRYARVGRYRAEDAEYLLIGQGAIVPIAEAVADHLRKARRIKVGVLDLTLLRPFPGDLLGHLLKGRKGAVVLEPLEHRQTEDPPLAGEVRAALGKCLENGQAKGEEAPFPGYPAYTRPNHTPPLYAALYGSGEKNPRPEGLIGAVENMLPDGGKRRRVFLSLDFTRQPARSPKEEIYLQSIAESYPGTASLRARGSENPDLLPKGAVSVRLHTAPGREVWGAEDHLGRTLAELAGLQVKAHGREGQPFAGQTSVLHVVAAPEPVRADCLTAPVDVVIVADPGNFALENPLQGLKEGGALILRSGAESPEVLWADIPEPSRKAMLERRIQLFRIDALAIATEEARHPSERLRILGRVLQGSALTIPSIEAATRLAGKPLLRALREMLRFRAGQGDPDVVPEVLELELRAFRRGMEERVLVPGLPESQRPSGGDASALREALPPAGQKDWPAHTVPALDIHRFWVRTGLPYARGESGENLAEPFVASGIVPAASAVFRDLAHTRGDFPRWNPEACTGCGQCWLICPEAALPGLVSGIGEFLAALVRRVEEQGHPARHLPRAVRTLEGKLREGIAKGSQSETDSVSQQIHAAVAGLVNTSKLAGEEKKALEQELAHLLSALGAFPLAVTDPYFTEMERASRGSGGLLSITVDPSKCSGCMDCVAVCPEEALSSEPQTPEVLAGLRWNWELWLRLPTTDERYIRRGPGSDVLPGTEGASGPESLLLDKRAYRSLLGNGAPGAAENTVLHLFAATVEAHMQPRVAAQLERLEELAGNLERHIRLNLAVDTEDPEALRGAMAALGSGEFTLSELSRQMDREREPVDVEWLQRVTGLLSALKQLQRSYAPGSVHRITGGAPEEAVGRGRASLGMVQNTGDAEAWGVRYPYNPFPYPWSGLPGVASAPAAMGLFEGHMARMAEGFKTVRMTELELEERYNPEVHEAFFARFGWRDFSQEEFLLCPPVAVVGGDRSLHGAGLAGLSSLLRSGLPIKVLCLDGQAYGALASPDPAGEVAVHGTALPAGAELPVPSRQHLPLAALAHMGAFIAQGSLADPLHLLECFQAGLASPRPALLNVFAGPAPAHGMAGGSAMRQARLALESRAHPFFLFDPDRAEPLHECLSLEGNPAPDAPWPLRTLKYLDGDGNEQAMEYPVTFADFAAAMPGLEHHFRPAGPEQREGDLLPLAEYLELEEDGREEARPFVWSLDRQRKLLRLLVSPALVRACGERKRSWEALRNLTRLDIVPVDEEAIAGQARAEMVEKVAQSLFELAQGGGELPSALLELASPEGDGAEREATQSNV